MKSNTLPSLGFLEKKLSNEELEPIWKEIQKIQKNHTNSIKFNHNLVGHIKKEYELFDCKEHLEKIGMDMIIEYHKNYSYPGHLEMVDGPHKLTLRWLWANFMKKGEFNPAHGHNGVMSFVLWLKVPYLIEDEDQLYPDVTPDKLAGGRFALHYTDTIGTINTFLIPADQRYEGIMIMFPSQMRHSVYPFFSSNDERISISGNFLFKPIN